MSNKPANSQKQFFPKNSTNTGVTWVSLDPTIATVDANGLVTAVAIGSATIIAITDDGGFIDNCVVTASHPSSIVTITAPSSGDEFIFGQVITVTATGFDTDGIEKLRFIVDGGRYENIEANSDTSFQISLFTALKRVP